MKNKRMDLLCQKGVKIPNPESVYIGEEVDIDRISGQGVSLFAGTKIIGERSLILPNVRIGYEAPVTLENTLVGENTRLDGGFFQDAVFAGDNVFGSGGHVRKGTILEEEANAAHTVGLKQTILFPFVTLGSLINFCDCFMAGGTSRKDHSEVGSSFVHFNYTPNQDKATPSMMGNVHQGVMLNQKPIFLGGQGGIVGPLRMGYGCITAAGSIIRKNELANDRLILGGVFKEISLPRRMGVYSHVDVILNNNMTYIAGLISLNAWYRFVRPLFVHDFFSEELLLGMQRNLANCIGERRKQLKILNEKLLISKEILLTDTKGKETSAICLHKAAIEKLKKADAIFGKEMDSDLMTREGEIFIKAVETEVGKKRQKYISVIQNLDPQVAMTGSQWLYDIEKKICTPLLITAAKEKSGN
ncbi:MAG: protein GlmU [Proteobacteria bacterium]|nr:protein GlmU [Desulfobacula sp.]MBU4132148.1 protein GlmU [Pseudomonadota bacterium]